MKLKINGYEIEGETQEIKKLLGIENKQNTTKEKTKQKTERKPDEALRKAIKKQQNNNKKRNYPRHNKTWTYGEDKYIKEMYQANKTDTKRLARGLYQAMSQHLKRPVSTIRNRLWHLKTNGEIQ